MNQINTRKKSSYKGLDKLSVYLHDNSSNSNNYFVLSDIPEEFGSGKNLIKILGNSDTLERGSTVLVEIIDSQGNVIYTEYNDYIDENNRRYITAYIYPETIPGFCTLTIVGIAKYDLISRPDQILNIPREWVGVHNLKWQKRIKVSPMKRNSSEIIFSKPPSITVTELFKPENILTYSTGSIISYSSSAIYKPTLHAVTNYSYLTNNSDTAKNFSSYSSLFTPNNLDSNISTDRIEIKRLSAEENEYPKQTENLLIGQGIDAPGGFGAKTINSAILTITGSGDADRLFHFSKDMENGEITFPNPQVQPLPDVYSYYSSADVAYKATIKKVINQNTVALSEPYKRLVIPTGNNRAIPQYKYIEDFTTSNFVISHSEAPSYSSSQNWKNVFHLDIGNIEPISGDVYKIKAYYKSKSSIGDYKLLSDSLFKSNNLFVDPTSYNPDNAIGNITSNSKISTYWSCSTSDNTMVDIKATGVMAYSSEELINSIEVGTFFTVPNLTGKEFVKLIPNFNLSNTPYTMKFYGSGSYSIKFSLKGMVTTTNPPISFTIYMSGSAFNNSDTSNDFGKYVGKIEVNTEKIYPDIQFNFTSDNNGTGTPVFIMRGGKWWINDIYIDSTQEIGFTPNHTVLDIPFNSTWDGDVGDIKVEFHDYMGNMSNQVVYVKDVTVKSGSATYIQGKNNVVPGKLFISDTINSGIELSGDNFGKILSNNYPGWDESTLTNGSGFLLWSGSGNYSRSIAEKPTSYIGIGIEFITPEVKFRLSSANGLQISSSGFVVSDGLSTVNSASYAISASYAVSASHEITYEISSSYSDYALSSSHALYAISSSRSDTSSFALNSISSSYALTASSANDFNIRGNLTGSGNFYILSPTTASLLVQNGTILISQAGWSTPSGIEIAARGNITASTSTANILISALSIENTATNLYKLSAVNLQVSGTIKSKNNVIAPSFTGSLFGTASWAISCSNLPYGLLSSSAQIATAISGAHQNYLSASIYGTPTYIPIFNTSHSISSSNIFKLNEKIGINTSQPNYSLDLNTGSIGYGVLNTRIELKNNPSEMNNSQAGFYYSNNISGTPEYWPAGFNNNNYLISTRFLDTVAIDKHYLFQIATPLSTTTPIYYRKTDSTSTGSWYKIITELMTSSLSVASASISTTSSYSLSSSISLNSISSSYSTTSSYSLSSSWAPIQPTSSYALTSSYISGGLQTVLNIGSRATLSADLHIVNPTNAVSNNDILIRGGGVDDWHGYLEISKYGQVTIGGLSSGITIPTSTEQYYIIMSPEEDYIKINSALSITDRILSEYFPILGIYRTAVYSGTVTSSLNIHSNNISVTSSMFGVSGSTKLDGGVYVPFKTVFSNYTASLQDHVVVLDTTSNDITLLLPEASPALNGLWYRTRKISTSNIAYISASEGQFINADGVIGNAIIVGAKTTYSLYCSGSGWVFLY